MAASFPGAIKNFSAIVNGITKLVAALFNSPYEEITAIETALGANMVGVRLGALVDKSGSYDTQQATTDGFIEVIVDGTGLAGGNFAKGYTDAANPPTTFRGVGYGADTDSHFKMSTFTMVVKKNDYWRVIKTGSPALTVSWIPLGA